MKDRDLHALAKLTLDIKTIRSLDVFKVNAAKGRLKRRNHLHKAINIEFIDLYVKDINACELLKEHRLALHHGLGSKGANVA